MRIGKYVIVKNHPILFPAGLAHSDVVSDAQSAGFFILRFSGGSVDVLCWGESIGLNIKSRGAADARIITEFMGRIASLVDRVPGGYPLSEV